ncbi:MAG: hypothetical protein IKU60_04260 [Clostridia bacterium]|nr:hypothetical protein [Clostridia bacterium]
MKKLIFLILIFTLIFPVSISAKEDYITLSPFLYSSHHLGEDLVIYGDTSLPTATLGFYYPEDQGYKGYAKFIINISAKELREGYVIPTEEYSRLWPEGVWTVAVQNGAYRDEIKIPMSKDAPLYNRQVRLAHYRDNTLTSLTTYTTQGIQISSNTISFTLEDSTLVKIYAWDNLSPTNDGDAQLFAAVYKDGYMTEAKTYSGTLSSYGKHISLEISETERFELLFWNDSLIPY